MPNPSPKIENLKPFKPKGATALSGRLFVRVAPEIESAVKSLPRDGRSDWLRRVITEAAQRELMTGKDEKNG